MEIIPVGQHLKVIERPRISVRNEGLFVAQSGRIARDEPLPVVEQSPEQRPTTHPVLDLIYRPEIRRAITESEPPRQEARRYPQFEQRLGDNVGNFLNVMI
jgi:hypothetical protein